VVPAVPKDHPVLSDLTDEFDCSKFSCGDDIEDEEVTSFFRNQALEEHRLNLNRTKVLHYPVDFRALGFITMSMGQVGIKFGGLPDHPVGCVHVAYLGIQKEYHQRGWGSWLLAFAIDVAIKFSSELGCRGVALNCRDKRLPWYEYQGFERKGGGEDTGGPLNRMFFDILGEASEPVIEPFEKENDGGHDSAT
jgi:GNAT superfamily N-acetyltransferase